MIHLIETLAIIALAVVAGVILANDNVIPAVVTILASVIFAIPTIGERRANR